jgi:hypothetical protein
MVPAIYKANRPTPLFYAYHLLVALAQLVTGTAAPGGRMAVIASLTALALLAHGFAHRAGATGQQFSGVGEPSD